MLKKIEIIALTDVYSVLVSNFYVNYRDTATSKLFERVTLGNGDFMYIPQVNDAYEDNSGDLLIPNNNGYTRITWDLHASEIYIKQLEDFDGNALATK